MIRGTGGRQTSCRVFSYRPGEKKQNKEKEKRRGRPSSRKRGGELVNPYSTEKVTWGEQKRGGICGIPTAITWGKGTESSKGGLGPEGKG